MTDSEIKALLKNTQQPKNLEQAIKIGLSSLNNIKKLHTSTVKLVHMVVRDYLAHKFQPYFQNEVAQKIWEEIVGPSKEKSK